MAGAGGKVVIVTGAGRGIGASIARTLAGGDWQVLCADLDWDSAHTLAMGIGAAAVQCDVGSEVEVERLVALARTRFGRIDAIVSNAGIGKFAPLAAPSLADWNSELAPHLNAAFLLPNSAARALRTQ